VLTWSGVIGVVNVIIACCAVCDGGLILMPSLHVLLILGFKVDLVTPGVGAVGFKLIVGAVGALILMLSLGGGAVGCIVDVLYCILHNELILLIGLDKKDSIFTVFFNELFMLADSCDVVF
jgi:hypothetical protein